MHFFLAIWLERNESVCEDKLEDRRFMGQMFLVGFFLGINDHHDFLLFLLFLNNHFYY